MPALSLEKWPIPGLSRSTGRLQTIWGPKGKLSETNGVVSKGHGDKQVIHDSWMDLKGIVPFGRADHIGHVQNYRDGTD